MKMISARISRVENGWILQVTKIDILNGGQAGEEAYIYATLPEVFAKISQESGERPPLETV